ncbi:CRAL/TRIO domain-containing protein [Vararia minispora EC-137]|uniref:CRAL/TRIO domain-containing protein n=1 Tax=Vararia minispora EC-137 TaxID=1314806 RepID=A0ACB8QSA0_9AGAM|nr:CRAL/TRIO domain-containing protein [Vararia minispora EC-137]
MTGGTPICTPLLPSQPPAGAIRPAEDLSTSQAGMLESVLGHFCEPDYELPGEKEPGLRDLEKFWLTRDCMLRYLRAVKWASAQEAIQRLEGTLKWRREFEIYETTADDIEPESVTGKMIIYGYDTARRPALYLLPSRQNTKEAQHQIQFTVWMLERTLDLTGPGVETLSLMINFADRAKSPSFSTARAVLNILQTHYPERLGHALILNVPFLLNAFFKLITPLVDPHTRVKMKFNPRAVKDGLFDAEQLLSESGWGGAVDFRWDHAKYWPALLKLCAETRERYMERWRKLGAKVGASEWDIKFEPLVAPSDETVSVKVVEQPAPVAETEQVDIAVPGPGMTEIAGPAAMEGAADTLTVPLAVAGAVPKVAGQA